MQAVTALAHLKAAVLFIMDISEQCDRTIEEQFLLFESIKPLFANKPVFVGLNKIDVKRRIDLSEEQNTILKKIEEGGVPVVEISTISEEGIIDFRNQVLFEKLLCYH